ncbi:nuclear transport factor 2 family protein [Proteobacteria bacterium 005FR1]|nr:nuclear transport factor 2 family protein [Proteobacteria bacterium 005FR1]
MKKSILALVACTVALLSFSSFADHHGGGHSGKKMSGLTPKDYMEIEQLYAQYNWAIDSGEAQAWADTFVDDGNFNNAFKGKEQLKGFINRWVSEMNGLSRKHWNSNLHVTGDGKTAQGKVYLLLIDKSQQPAAIISSASYADELVKTDEGWRFVKRVVNSDRPAK